MIRSARQLKDKIRNLASDKSADAQVLLRNYMMERFLERISVSDYSQKFILKGGVLITSMVGFEARSTMDIDTSIRGENISVNDIQHIIKNISSIDLTDGVNFIINGISEIMDDAEYPGVRIAMTAFMNNIRVPLKVDISTGDIITPCAVEYSYKLMFESRVIHLMAYNLETVLAEKLETIIARTITNTRMRDFYDLHILLEIYRKDIDSDTLANALLATSNKRGSTELLNNIEKVLSDLHSSKDMESLWNNYRAKFSYAKDITWTSVLHSLHELTIMADLVRCRDYADDSCQ